MAFHSFAHSSCIFSAVFQMCVAKVSTNSSVHFHRMKCNFYCFLLDFFSLSLAEKVHLSNAPVFLYWIVKKLMHYSQMCRDVLFSGPYFFFLKLPKILLKFIYHRIVLWIHSRLTALTQYPLINWLKSITLFSRSEETCSNVENIAECEVLWKFG